MTIFAQWINQEETTMEVCIDGASTYVIRTLEGEYQFPSQIDKVKFDEWLSSGNKPLQYKGG